MQASSCSLDNQITIFDFPFPLRCLENCAIYFIKYHSWYSKGELRKNYNFFEPQLLNTNLYISQKEKHPNQVQYLHTFIDNGNANIKSPFVMKSKAEVLVGSRPAKMHKGKRDRSVTKATERLAQLHKAKQVFKQTVYFFFFFFCKIEKFIDSLQ